MATQAENDKLDSLDQRLSKIEVRFDEVFAPALLAIKAKLDADTYATKTELKAVADDVAELRRTTRNTPIVERVVFGVVAFILLAVLGAIVALVVINKGGN